MMNHLIPYFCSFGLKLLVVILCSQNQRMAPKHKKTFVHPAQDNTLSKEHVTAQDPRDPRVANGPCGDTHSVPLTPRATLAPPSCLFGGNQYGRWMECEKCALRLMYWPKLTYVGKYTQTQNPAAVQAALRALTAEGIESSHAAVTRLIRKYEADLKVKQLLPKGKASSSNNATAVSPDRADLTEIPPVVLDQTEDEPSAEELKEYVLELMRLNAQLRKKNDRASQ